jgi:multisubunit Na+/H+ antiporter MnhB subunit
MIPQGMRPILALLTIAVGLLVMANYWIEFVETEVDVLTSHAVGLIGLFSGMNMMSTSTEAKEEQRPRYLEDTQTKF